jgi:stage V sporulation protein B
MSKKNFIEGTLILSTAGLLTRLLGFFYRIFLSQAIGAQGLGIYQLILPVQTLILSVTSSGIQMAISRLCASSFALHREREGCDSFTFGTFCSVVFTSILSLLLYRHADFFAAQILKEADTAELLRLLSFSLPLSALHACICGFYFSRKKTVVPSVLQLLEQLARIGSSYLIYQILLSEGRPVTAGVAVGGALVGEICSAVLGLLFMGFYFKGSGYHPLKLRQGRLLAKRIFSLAAPLSLNRILLTLIGSMEVVLIPRQLVLYGLSSEEALSVYGIFTGMALPLIQFPSTITQSISAMLMPSIATLQALGYRKRIQNVTRQICLALFGLGGGCCLIFYFFGNSMGTLLFHNAAAGNYIRSMAFLCPFLYLHTILASILHGLGRTGTCLIHNLISAGIRLGFVVFSIPVLGIRGYLYGLLLSELVLTLLHLSELWRCQVNVAPVQQQPKQEH